MFRLRIDLTFHGANRPFVLLFENENDRKVHRILSTESRNIKYFFLIA